jgi:hypothetical protein
MIAYFIFLAVPGAMAKLKSFLTGGDVIMVELTVVTPFFQGILSTDEF